MAEKYDNYSEIRLSKKLLQVEPEIGPLALSKVDQLYPGEEGKARRLKDLRSAIRYFESKLKTQVEVHPEGTPEVLGAEVQMESAPVAESSFETKEEAVSQPAFFQKAEDLKFSPQEEERVIVLSNEVKQLEGRKLELEKKNQDLEIQNQKLLERRDELDRHITSLVDQLSQTAPKTTVSEVSTGLSETTVAIPQLAVETFWIKFGDRILSTLLFVAALGVLALVFLLFVLLVLGQLF